MISMLVVALAVTTTTGPAPSALDHAAVGDWVTYRADGGGARVAYLRFAVTGAERDSRGRDAVWLDLEVGTHPDMLAPVARVSVLTARSEGLTRAGITRLLLAAGPGKWEELPASAFDQFLPVPVPTAASASSQAPQLEPTARTVSTPAGTFPARCLDSRASGRLVRTLCLHPAIPLLGIVELSVPVLGHSLRLHAYGTAATRRMPAGPDRPTIGQER